MLGECILQATTVLAYEPLQCRDINTEWRSGHEGSSSMGPRAALDRRLSSSDRLRHSGSICNGRTTVAAMITVRREGDVDY